MHRFKVVAVALAGSALLVAGCGKRDRAGSGGANRTGSEVAVIQQAFEAVHAAPPAGPSPFPREEGVAPCKIPVGGAAQGRTIDGTCSTTVRPQGRNKVVTFTETWNASDVRDPGSPRAGLMISVWQITLDPSGKVVRQVHTGDVPPQQAG